MQVSAAGTGVRLSDGSTQRPAGRRPRRRARRRGARTSGWRCARSTHGFYQGWDLHPAQLVTRYAANYAFYLGNAAADAKRLRAYVDEGGRGRAGRTRDGASACHVDATGAGLRRAVLADDVERLCGLSEVELGRLVRREAL